MTPVVLASGWSICDVADSGFCNKLFSANKNEIEFWGSSITRWIASLGRWDTSKS